ATPLDRFAYRDNRGDSTSGVTEAIEPGERKAHAAVQDQDDDLVAPPVESLGQLGQLNRGTGVVVRLRTELEDAEGLGQRQAPKNARTAATTRSISSSVWSADIGRLRISSTSRSVRGTASDAKHPTAGWRWVGIGKW